METIRIGGDIKAAAKTPPTTPLRNLPNRLDAQACLVLLERIHPEWTVASITAAGKQLDVGEIDVCLQHTELSIEDRLTFKGALSEYNIISRGRRLA